MHGNYVLVLFKNKQKKKIIKSYQTLKNATKKFKELTNTEESLFPMKVENAENVNYEIGLLSSVDKNQSTIFTTDELGRNVNVFVEGQSPYVFLEIKPYIKEDKVYDWQSQKKLTLLEIIKTYCKPSEMKNIFTLHNKLIIQIEDTYNLFSLKNIEDCERALHSIESYYRQKNRKDAIFVRDISTVHRKWIYDILVEKGFSKSKLYRQSTTFSKRK
jgi:hypothetical protein